MAGGNFTLTAKKTRPGTYVNFVSEHQTLLGYGARGIVLLPLIKHNYGPAGEFIEIKTTSPDSCYEKLGYSIYDDDPNGNMLLIREALKNAQSVVVFLPTAGTKATATVQTGDMEAVELTATARYGGSLGNSLKVAIVANAEVESTFDVVITLDNAVVDRVNAIKTVGDVKKAGLGWVDFTGENDEALLKANPGVPLATGADGSTVTKDFTDMLDRAENVHFNTIAFPYKKADNAETQRAVIAKVKYLRQNVGLGVQAVLSGEKADYEGIINVTNGVILEDNTEISAEMACAYVAGITAAATYTQSNTYKKYIGAKAVLNPKSNDEAEQAIRDGEFFFSYDSSFNVVIEYDINSLTTFADGKDESYRKNRVIRVLDTIGELLYANFPPNKFDNTRTGWDVMEGIGRSLLTTCQTDGAIEEFEPSTDFLVDATMSKGDETYFNVAVKPIDSAEKLFFTVKTR